MRGVRGRRRLGRAAGRRAAAPRAAAPPRPRRRGVAARPRLRARSLDAWALPVPAATSDAQCAATLEAALAGGLGAEPGTRLGHVLTHPGLLEASTRRRRTRRSSSTSPPRSAGSCRAGDGRYDIDSGRPGALRGVGLGGRRRAARGARGPGRGRLARRVVAGAARRPPAPTPPRPSSRAASAPTGPAPTASRGCSATSPSGRPSPALAARLARAGRARMRRSLAPQCAGSARADVATAPSPRALEVSGAEPGRGGLLRVTERDASRARATRPALPLARAITRALAGAADVRPARGSRVRGAERIRRMGEAPVAQRLLAAMNAHDLDAFAAASTRTTRASSPRIPTGRSAAATRSPQLVRDLRGHAGLPAAAGARVRRRRASSGASGAGTAPTPTAAALDMAGRDRRSACATGGWPGRGSTWSRSSARARGIDACRRARWRATSRSARADARRRPRTAPALATMSGHGMLAPAQVGRRSDALEPAARELDPLQPHAGELGAAEVAALEADVAQDRLARARLAQVAVGEHDALQPRGGEAREVDPAAARTSRRAARPRSASRPSAAPGRPRPAAARPSARAGWRGRRRPIAVSDEVQVGQPRAGERPRTRHSASVRWRTASSPAPVSSTAS